MTVFLGVDLGSGGARAVAITGQAEILATASIPFAKRGVEGLVENDWEQDPETWWNAVLEALETLSAQMDPEARKQVVGLGLCSTSGTLLLLDEDRRPVRPAIMYSDGRAKDQVKKANDAAWRTIKKVGIRFGPSYALPKLLWIKENEPHHFERGCLVAHAADYIVGRLTDVWGVSDFNNALKTGYNVVERRWPAYLTARLKIPRQMLPKVVAPGECLGNMKQEWVRKLDFPKEVRVVAGTTDGVAGLLASGASVPGEWCSTLGTTLVVKGIQEERLRDPEGRFYCHLHPQGWWLPGGASNVGGECLEVKFEGKNWAELDNEVERWVPTDMVIYPLIREGERLPFKNPEAVGFMAGKATCDAHLFAGYLEGVALVERWTYDLLNELECPIGERIFVSGGGARSLPWLKIRASVLKKTLVRTQYPEACLGGAILANSSFQGGDLSSACRSLARVVEEIPPDPELSHEYGKRYTKLRKACDAIGYG